MSDLVQRLCNGEHPVEITLRPEQTIEALKECLDRGYVHVKFTSTRGGTELGVRVDPERSDLTRANFDRREGHIRVVGGLTLDYVNVRCIADIDLPTFQGTGRLERVES